RRGLSGLSGGDPGVRRGSGADGAGVPGGLSPGLRLRGADLRLSERRDSRCGSLTSLSSIASPQRTEIMEAEAAKFIGAGLATLGMIGAGIGVGTIFSGFLQGALRNPSAAGSQFTNLVLGFALTEALGILAFVLGLLILFS